MTVSARLLILKLKQIENLLDKNLRELPQDIEESFILKHLAIKKELRVSL